MASYLELGCVPTVDGQKCCRRGTTVYNHIADWGEAEQKSVDVTGLLIKYGCSVDEVTAMYRAEQGQPGTYKVRFSRYSMSNLDTLHVKQG